MFHNCVYVESVSESVAYREGEITEFAFPTFIRMGGSVIGSEILIKPVVEVLLIAECVLHVGICISKPYSDYAMETAIDGTCAGIKSFAGKNIVVATADFEYGIYTVVEVVAETYVEQ